MHLLIYLEDRAQCAVMATIDGGDRTARASLNQVKNAAHALSLRCAAGSEYTGSIATNIGKTLRIVRIGQQNRVHLTQVTAIQLTKNSGGDNKLAVVLSSYIPNIQCQRDSVFRNGQSCGSLLADMPATMDRILFGPHGTPGIQEPLPQIVLSGRRSMTLHLSPLESD